jgi:hypothetical protein
MSGCFMAECSIWGSTAESGSRREEEFLEWNEEVAVGRES